ncbi:MAG TPA: fimbria/pilus outer membrane usher protein, partial [Rhodanobacter sp.]|nr:fimbria/pilus outer membrane usher protein [Rhodanobacter sp.]
AAAATAGPDASLDASFDRSMLSGAGQNTTDLARFERGNFVAPGSYSLDLFLNETRVGRANVRFVAPSANASAVPCVTADLLDRFGLHPQLTPDTEAALKAPGACVRFDQIIPGASLSVDMADLKLTANVPQAALGLAARGYVDPKYWDAGVDAGLLNYRFNSYRTQSGGQAQTSAYLGLNAGVNLGAWHLRHDSALTWQSAIGNVAARRRFQTIDTYVQRDLPAWRAQLTIGDSFTPGDVFDSFGLRGVQVATDDRMLPQSLRGYAPTVRGVAETNAKVTVRQNGLVIYQTTVPPGPFVIDDLYATGYSGNFDVEVDEANGRVHHFSVPFASVPQLLRPGLSRFSIAAGQLRDTTIAGHPNVAQLTFQHGFTNLLTGYTGAAAATGYGEMLLGGALNTRVGAVALDVSSARTRIPGMHTLSGQSLRLSYSKTLAETGTSLTLAAYRYSTSGFLGLDDAMRARDYASRGLPAFATGAAAPITLNGVPLSPLLTPAQQAALAGIDPLTLLAPRGVDRMRNNFSLTLSQRLGDRAGSLYVSGSTHDYWNRGGRDTQYQVGWNNTLGRLGYGLSASRERDLFGRTESRYMLNLTVQLGTGAHAPALMGTVSHDDAGGNQAQATLSGTAGADNQYTYGATLAHGSGGFGASGTTVNANGGYRGPHVELTAGLGSGSGYSQASFGAAGGIVAWAGGVSFGQSLGDTVAIVQAPGATGARVGNAVGVSIDRSGHALVPYLNPYIQNTIDIDPAGVPLDVQLDGTSVKVAPHAGAVVLVKFKTESGHFVLIRTHLASGGLLPFGAEVLDAKGQPIGVVGQAGQIMARLPNDAGTLQVEWQADDGANMSCRLPYSLAPDGIDKTPARGRGITQIDAVCRALATTELQP